MTRILLVEDNEMNRDAISRLLERRGFTMLVAADGEEGVRVCIEALPDLVLMDLGLPGIDGFEATRRLKAHAATRAIPVVALTARALTSDRQAAFDAGCDDYDSKPVDLAGLVDKIRRLTGPAEGSS